MSDLMTLEQATEYLTVSARTVRRLVDNGDLAHIRITSKLIRVTKADLDAVVRKWRVEVDYRGKIGSALPGTDDILAAQAPNQPISGIYFLIEGDEIVYVGQSIDVHSRLITHRQQKQFSHFSYIEVPPELLDIVERAYISRFKPRLNRAVPKEPVTMEDLRKAVSLIGAT